MTAGLQVWNDSYFLQIDGYNQHVVLEGKGTVFGSTLTHVPAGVQGCTFQVPVPMGGMCAMQGQAPFTVAGKYNDHWQINMIGAGAGAWLNYWIFAPYTPSGVRCGMEIYSSITGELIYDTGRLPFRVAGEVSGLGSFTVGKPGRSYAIFPTQLYARLRRNKQAAQADPNTAVLTYVFDSGLVNINGQTVTTQNATVQSGVAGSVSGTSVPFGWEVDTTNNLQNTVTVIDVTDY